MKTHGRWLFRGSRKLTAFFDRLGPAVHTGLRLLVNEDVPVPEIQGIIDDTFLLRPLYVQDHLRTQVSVSRERYDRDGEERYRSPVQGYVPFEGSHLLWDVCPAPGFKFPLRGKVGKFGVNLCSYIDGKDVAPFEEFVAAELERLREVLHAFQPAVLEYNNRIRDQIAFQMKTF